MTIGQIIGLVVVLLLGLVGGFFITKKSKSHTAAKWLGLFILVTMGLTWIFTGGVYQGTQFYDYPVTREGLTDIANAFYNAIYFAGDKLIFLVVLGAFYGLLSKNRGYNKLVGRIAEVFTGHEYLFTFIASLLITIMTATFTQTFIVLLFVPFIISIALRMHLDKITAFALTFGSMLVGLTGTLYGGEGLFWFNNYTQTEFANGLLYRLIVLVIAYVLFNFLTVMRIKKLKREHVNEEAEDPFKMEKYDKKAHAWPISVMFILMFILVVLGYIDWKEIFNITIFDTFHTWLLGIKIGDFAIFEALLGTQSAAFGKWGFVQNSTTIIMGVSLMIFFGLIVALLNHRSLGEVVTNLEDGGKKMFKSTAMYVGVYGLMLVAYMSPFIPTIVNMIFPTIKSFNPYLVSAFAFVSNILHTDLGFTGYVVANYFMSAYQGSLEVIHTIFTTSYGFAGMFVPTSGLLLIGLSYLDIDYKKWFKHIWLYVVGMLIILLVLFTIMTYI